MRSSLNFSNSTLKGGQIIPETKFQSKFKINSAKLQNLRGFTISHDF